MFKSRAVWPNALAHLSLSFFASLTLVGCSFENLQRTATPETRSGGKVQEEVIYGDDDRHELFQEEDASVRTLSESTVALIKNVNIGANVGGLRNINGENFASAYGLCSNEPFAEQDVAAFCSGFLVAPDLIVTAGHCIKSLLDCSETSFVFDYAYKSPGAAPKSVASDNVFRCQEVIHSVASPSGSDFAIVRLDRAVTNRAPLTLRTSGELKKDEPLTVIGHPAGLPTKIAGGAIARDVTPTTHFIANLDTYGGNSGSAVFHSITHEVEGILVRGEVDFTWSPQGCATSYVCKNAGCRGEDVTKISEALKILGTL